MRVFKTWGRSGLVMLGVLLFVTGGTVKLRAAAGEEANPRPTKAEKASARLTERERWMLDRIEQLEQRVADLEAKNNAAP